MEVYNTSSNRLYHLVITESIVKHFALYMASFAISFLNFSFSISKLMQSIVFDYYKVSELLSQTFHCL